MVNESKSASKKGFYVLIALAAVAGIGALSYLSGRSKASSVIVLDPTLPPVASQGYVVGNPSAPIELVEFGDFECPGCGRFAALTEPDVRAQYVNTGKIRFRFIDFPLVGIHGNTLNASVAAACADEQGQFWAMHDSLYANQDRWNTETTRDPNKIIKALAHTVPGVDAAKFDDCLDTKRTLSKVQSHLKIAEDRKVNQTPTFAIGQQQFILQSGGIDELKPILDSALVAATSTRAPSAPAGTKAPLKTPKKP